MRSDMKLSVYSWFLADGEIISLIFHGLTFICVSSCHDLTRISRLMSKETEFNKNSNKVDSDGMKCCVSDGGCVCFADVSIVSRAVVIIITAVMMKMSAVFTSTQTVSLPVIRLSRHPFTAHTHTHTRVMVDLVICSGWHTHTNSPSQHHVRCSVQPLPLTRPSISQTQPIKERLSLTHHKLLNTQTYRHLLSQFWVVCMCWSWSSDLLQSVC